MMMENVRVWKYYFLLMVDMLVVPVVQGQVTRYSYKMASQSPSGRLIGEFTVKSDHECSMW